MTERCSWCEHNEKVRLNSEAARASTFDLFSRYYFQCQALDKGIKRLHRKIKRLEAENKMLRAAK